MSLVSVVCCQRSLRRADHSGRGVLRSVVSLTEFHSEALIMRRPWPTRDCCAMEIKITIKPIYLLLYVKLESAQKFNESVLSYEKCETEISAVCTFALCNLHDQFFFGTLISPCVGLWNSNRNMSHSCYVVI